IGILHLKTVSVLDQEITRRTANTKYRHLYPILGVDSEFHITNALCMKIALLEQIRKCKDVNLRVIVDYIENLSEKNTSMEFYVMGRMKNPKKRSLWGIDLAARNTTRRPCVATHS
ncbi:hypothetical protein L9F63_024278, partial [Diploptera punctata]